MKIKYIIPIFLILSAFSCQREAIVTEETEQQSYLSITVNNQAFSNNTTTSIDVRGSFLDEKKNTLDIDKLQINDFSIERDDEGNFYQNYNIVKNKDDYQKIEESMTSDRISIAIEDDMYGAKELSFQVPEPIKIIMPDDFEGVIDKNKGLRITWNPSSDFSRSNKSVAASVVYHNQISRKIDRYDTSAAVNRAIRKVQNDSEGELYFSASELSVLPSDGSVIIYMARGEQLEFEYAITGSTVSYVTSSTSRPYKVL